MADEVLAAGDTQTAFEKWLDTQPLLRGDKVVAVRSALATDYAVSLGSDVTTLLAKFLHDRT
jgi:hypothetical protein